jgi:2',3'-cyclic-nucleotide 2'-phosphodiesterase / 3'-nucleotidase
MTARLGRRALAATGLAAATAATRLARAADAAPTRLHLRLLETSDLHMFVYDYDYYQGRQDNTVGLAKVATLIKEARGEARNALLFDNGDIIQGNPLGDYVALPGHLTPEHGHPIFRAMDTLGYDAATVGNHEFNYGLPFLQTALRSASFPFVCANIVKPDGSTLFPPTIVLERDMADEAGRIHRMRIGVIGFVTPQIMVWDKSKLTGHVDTVDIVDAARRHVPGLRSRCDVLVALCHSGIGGGQRIGGEENASLFLASVPGIDVIFTGHQHRVFPGPDYAGIPGADTVHGTLNGVPAVMPGFWGSHLGLIDLRLERVNEGPWRVAGFQTEARPIYRRSNGQVLPLAKADGAILAAAAPEHAATLRWMEQPVGRTTAPITTFFSLLGSDPTLSLINAAQIAYARPLLAGTPVASLPLLSAASPFKAGGAGPNSFVDIPAGPLDMKDIANIYMFANTVCAVKVSGAELHEWLEKSCSIFNRIDPARQEPQELIGHTLPTFNFDVISGVTYEVDLSRPGRYDAKGQVPDPSVRRVVELRHEGRPVDPAAFFVVVTNNYRADGGGGFAGTGSDHVVLRAPDLNRDAIVRYITDAKTLTPAADATWRFRPLGRSVVVAFNGNDETGRHLDGRPIARLGATPDGGVRYGLTLA